MLQPSETKNRIYEELRELIRQNPEAFEIERGRLIADAIERFPASRRQRARQWQFQLEASLRHYKDPVARMNKMVEILWQQLELLQRSLCDPAKQPVKKRQAKAAEVIDLCRYRKSH